MSAAGAICPNSGTSGTGRMGTVQAFISQLSLYTNKDGLAYSTTDTTFKFGPYLKKNKLPANPITNNNTLNMKTTGNLVMMAQTKKGWQYDTKTGRYIADDDSVDFSGRVKYSEY